MLITWGGRVELYVSSLLEFQIEVFPSCIEDELDLTEYISALLDLDYDLSHTPGLVKQVKELLLRSVHSWDQKTQIEIVRVYHDTSKWEELSKSYPPYDEEFWHKYMRALTSKYGLSRDLIIACAKRR